MSDGNAHCAQRVDLAQKWRPEIDVGKVGDEADQSSEQPSSHGPLGKEADQLDDRVHYEFVVRESVNNNSFGRFLFRTG